MIYVGGVLWLCGIFSVLCLAPLCNGILHWGLFWTMFMDTAAWGSTWYFQKVIFSFRTPPRRLRPLQGHLMISYEWIYLKIEEEKTFEYIFKYCSTQCYQIIVFEQICTTQMLEWKYFLVSQICFWSYQISTNSALVPSRWRKRITLIAKLAFQRPNLWLSVWICSSKKFLVSSPHTAERECWIMLMVIMNQYYNVVHCLILIYAHFE